jgi:cytochrome c biogenesis protein CcmG, thiol:disulfide interchange protein DsbE
MRRQLIVGAAFAAALVVAVVASGTTSSTDKKKPAPALPTQVLVRPGVTVASLRGKPSAINFWASWCEPCRAEASGFARLPGQLSGRARIVGVDWNDSENDARAFVKKYGWRFPVLRDGSGAVGNNYGLTGLPSTFILNRQGRIVNVLHGPQTAQQIKTKLDAIVG